MADGEGREFGGYRIERRLGSGAAGTVYLAWHPRLPRQDALKVLSELRTDDSAYRERFLREAEIAARLQHPNLVAVRDRGEYDGRLWIAMQYVPGSDVAELIRHGPVEAARAVRIISEAARGLDEVHRAGLLHLDVKPANILIATPDGEAERVLVSDFGIARAAGDSDTAPGGFTGSLPCAAPEQIAGTRVDHRTDVYALGCTLYQLLTGDIPFARDNPAAVMYAHLHDPPPRPSAGNPSVPADFDAVIATALAKDPDARYQSCGVLAEAAQEALYRGLADSRAAPLHGRRRIIAVAGAVIIAVAVAVSLVVGLRPEHATSAADPRIPNTTSVEPANWGEYAYIVQAFPALLPPSPYTIGYQQVSTCYPHAYRGNDQVSFDKRADVGQLYCLGDRDPVYAMKVTCNANRVAIVPDGTLIERPEGDAAWTRSSGKGHMFWGTTTFPADLSQDVLSGKTMGVLDVFFEDPARNFCFLSVTGAADGTEIHDRWWPQAPL